MTPVGINPEIKRLDDMVRSGAVDPLELAMAQQQLGNWSSDHRREGTLLRGWNHVAITPICKMAARATVSIRKASGEGNRAEDDDRGLALPQSHELYRLVTNPNPWSTGALYRWEVVQQLHLHGQAIVWRVRDQRTQRTKYRICIPVGLTEPFPAGRYKEFPAGGITVRPIESVEYQRFMLETNYGALRFVSGRMVGIDDLILYRYPHAFLRSDGHSPTFAAAEWIELSQSIDAQRAKDIASGSGQKVLVTPPTDANASVTELNAFQRMMNDRLKSDDKLIAASHGASTLLSLNAEEMGYGQAFEQLQDAILAVHGTSKAAAGLQDQMTYGALAAAMDAFNVIAVQPDLDIIADEDTATIGAEYGEGITIAYKAPEITNPELEENKLLNDVTAGAITVGEYRERRGMKRYGDERDNLVAGSLAAKEYVPKTSLANTDAVAAGTGELAMFGRRQSKNARTTRNEILTGFIAGDISEAIARVDLSTLGYSQQSIDAMIEDARDGSIDSPDEEPTEGLAQTKAWMKSMGRFSSSKHRPYVIAVDLDGTLAEHDGDYVPGYIGPPRPNAVRAMQMLHKSGAKLVIFTVRDEDEAVAAWLTANEIPFDAINDNPWSDSTSGKIMADMYWDDRAVSADGPITASLAELTNLISSSTIRDKMKEQLTGRTFRKDTGFLYVPIEGESAKLIRSIGAGIDSSTVIELEDMPHVTLLPFVMAASTEDVVRLLRPAGQFHIRFGELDIFPANESRPSDCLHVVVTSPELMELQALSADHLPYVSSYDQYNPHATVAYVEPGMGRLLAGPCELTGKACRVKKLVYKPPCEAPVVIPLRETKPEMNGRAKSFLTN